MLTVHNLSIQTSEKQLVENLNLTVKLGQSWFIYGANGAGKSTLMRALSGITGGQEQGISVQGMIELNGMDLDTFSPIQLARQRSWLPQTQTDAFGWTVFETVLAGRYPYSGGLWENGTDIAMAEDALRQMDLMALADRDIRTLSGGERQRTAIAAVIAQDTPLILMDEPSTALDLPHQQTLMQFIHQQSLQQKALMTIVHDINLARTAATHVLLLNGDGTWEAGERTTVMTSEKLSHCLHNPIKAIPFENGEAVFVSI